jgi:hypothetical protein
MYMCNVEIQDFGIQGETNMYMCNVEIQDFGHVLRLLL